ncbi:unnamed protein product, partial [Ectocarpus sp. 12 AP-2014]
FLCAQQCEKEWWTSKRGIFVEALCAEFEACELWLTLTTTCCDQVRVHVEGADVDSLRVSAKRTIFQQFRKCVFPLACWIPQVTLGAARYSGKDPVARHGSKNAQTLACSHVQQVDCCGYQDPHSTTHGETCSNRI